MKQKKDLSKTKTVYNKLKQMIVTGEFSGSHNWSLRTLAGKFNLSVAPVNVAVRQLENEGLLTVSPQKGISIKQLSIPQIKETNIIREALEIQAIRLITMQNDADVIDSLYKIACKITEAFKISMKKYYLLDCEFHLKIIKESGLNLLIQEYEKLSTVCMISSEFLGVEYFGNNTNNKDSHLQIVKAIKSGDPDKAERVLRKHIGSDASKLL
jgi:DNA-binding GntR family transcriptional regulator